MSAAAPAPARCPQPTFAPPRTPLELPASTEVIVTTGADAQTRAAWQRLVDAAPQSTVFHGPAWFEAVRRCFGHPYHLLTALKTPTGSHIGDPDVLGLLALTDVRSRWTGRRLVSAAYGTSGGILSRDGAMAHRLIAEAEQLAARLGAAVVELRSAEPAAPGWQSDFRYVEFVRELPGRVSDLDVWLPRKARSAARQARDREGLVVRHHGGDLDLVWDLYSRSMRRLGSLNYPRRFFRELALGLRDRLWVTTVWRGPRPVAGVVSFSDRETIRPYFSGLDERVRCTGCANLLYRALMERAIEEGHARFDFGRTRRENAGAFEFKKNQGFEARPLEYRRFVPAGREPMDVSPSNPRFAPARRMWPRLPISFTRPLGAWLSRSFPG